MVDAYHERVAGQAAQDDDEVGAECSHVTFQQRDGVLQRRVTGPLAGVQGAVLVVPDGRLTSRRMSAWA